MSLPPWLLEVTAEQDSGGNSSGAAWRAPPCERSRCRVPGLPPPPSLECRCDDRSCGSRAVTVRERARPRSKAHPHRSELLTQGQR